MDAKEREATHAMLDRYLTNLRPLIKERLTKARSRSRRHSPALIEALIHSLTGALAATDGLRPRPVRPA